MKRVIAMTLALGFGASSPLLLAADPAEAEAQAKCAQWAQEDGVKEEEMDQYMADCVADQLGGQEAAPSGESVPEDASKEDETAPSEEAMPEDTGKQEQAAPHD